jgi:PhnB protein
VVAFFHHPAFSSGPHEAAVVEHPTAAIRSRYMPIFRTFGVKMLCRTAVPRRHCQRRLYRAEPLAKPRLEARNPLRRRGEITTFFDPKKCRNTNLLSEQRAMSPKPIPTGFHSVNPAIVVRRAAEAIDFYKRAFGAEEVSRMTGPDGSILHAEIRIGDSVVMLGEENPQWGTLSPESTKGNPGSLHLYVGDADAVFEQAVKAGAKVRMPLEDAFWGDRYGKITDPFGHEWGIATRVKDLTPEQIKQAADTWMAKAAQG